MKSFNIFSSKKRKSDMRNRPLPPEPTTNGNPLPPPRPRRAETVPSSGRWGAFDSELYLSIDPRGRARSTPSERSTSNYSAHPLFIGDFRFSIPELNTPVHPDTNPKPVTDTTYQLTTSYGGKDHTYTIPRSDQYSRDAIGYHDGSVAMTLSRIKQRCIDNDQPFLRPCPIGLTKAEKERFCMYMEYRSPSLKEGGWEVLAERLMALDCDDIDMIQNFGYQTHIPVMEVILEHWHILYCEIKPAKWKLKPCKPILIHTIEGMGRKDILHEMQWSTNWRCKYISE